MAIVKYTSKLRCDLGRERDSVAAGSVSELLEELEERYGEAFASWLPHCSIFINGQSVVDLDGRRTSLAEGDEVLFLLPVAGG